MRWILGAAALCFAVPAQAQFYYHFPDNVPDGAFITIGGLDWAWASPYRPQGDANGDFYISPVELGYQGRLGWRLPTVEEFAGHPVADDFVFPGAWGDRALGAPTNEVACAAGYFTGYDFCLWTEAAQGHWYDPSLPPDGQLRYQSLVVRPHGFTPAGPIPEPAAWAMLIGGFGLAGATVRRRASKVSFAA